MAFLKRLWSAAPIATVILGLALLASGLFAARTVAFWVYWNDPAHREQAIAGWMTPGYVAQSWGVPRPYLFEALGVPPRPEEGRLTLDDLAARRAIPTDQMIAETEAAIAAFRAADPSAPGDR